MSVAAIDEDGTFFDTATNVPIDVSVKTRRNQAAVNRLTNALGHDVQFAHRDHDSLQHNDLRRLIQTINASNNAGETVRGTVINDACLAARATLRRSV